MPRELIEAHNIGVADPDPPPNLAKCWANESNRYTLILGSRALGVMKQIRQTEVAKFR